MQKLDGRIKKTGKCDKFQSKPFIINAECEV